ncbi:MAG: ABC transporter permease [Acidobacteriota bacterium]|nr:MAG: ABC transporter permease [Acidobacteriota bacterium]
MRGIIQDLRYGVRMLVKRPGFSLVALITLALGIGANTAVFSVINTVLLKREPYPNAGSLVVIWGKLKRVDEVEVSPRELAAYRERSRAFAEIGAGEIVNLNLTGGGDPLRLQGYAVTDNLFPVLGTKPLLGRTFTPREDSERARVAVLDYRLWQSRFAGSEGVIGRTIMLDGSGYTVIGVMPGEFHFPPPVSNRTRGDIFVPRSIGSETRLDSHNLVTIGLLKPGVSYEQARSEFEEISRRRKEEDPRTQVGANLVPLTAAVGRQLRPSLLILAGAVGLVLLIACANVANLLLAGATARRNEIAVRMALGAGRWRIARQMLIESLLLSISGGGLGLLLAVWAGDLVRLLGESRIPRADQISVDGMVLAFTMLISVLTGVIFGLAPAMQASHGDLNASLKEGGRGAKGGNNRVHSVLVVVEVALSLVLLISAGLMLRSFWRLLNVEPGFDPKNLLNVELALPETKYSENSQIRAFQTSVIERVAALPGVQSAAVVNHPPYSGRRGISVFRIEGRPEPEGLDDTPLADFRVVSPGYFRMMGIPVLQGRALTEGDADGAPPAVLVNRAFVARYMPDENPLGKRLVIDDEMATIAGIAGDIRQSGLDDEAAPHVYASSLQFPVSRIGLLVRTSVDPMSLVGALRRQIQAVDREQPIYNIATMEEWIADSMSERRLYLWLLGSFAAIALALATVGIYGVISYSVSRRTQEIGIRMALGAQARDMRRMVIRQGMAPALIGVAIGLATALALGRIIESMLFETEASDPATIAAVSLMLVAVALLACLVPARRAAKVDPMAALRCE